MTRYALLCGSAPEDYRQKKLCDLYDSLLEKGEWYGTAMPNGVNELMFEYAMNNIISGNAGDEASGVLLYFCAEKPVSDSETSLWLGGSEIRKEVIAHYASLCKESEIDLQVIYDSDSELISEDELGYEKV